MDYNDLELLAQYLADVQSPVNEVRKTAEAALLQSRDTAPEDY